jgi:heme-degrading monooxygenase HmoA
MILRTWRGSTRLEDRERYLAYLNETGVKEYKSTPGNQGVWVVRRELNERAEFLLLTLWDSMEAVQRFAGASPERAVFYPDDDEFLIEKDEHVDHYEVLVALPNEEPARRTEGGSDAVAPVDALRRDVDR